MTAFILILLFEGRVQLSILGAGVNLDRRTAQRTLFRAGDGTCERLGVRGKLERKGESLEWPAKLKPDTAEMAALPPSRAPTQNFPAVEFPA